MADDDEETSFDVNMDKIMQRFKCFNQVSVSNNSEDEDTNKDDTDDTSKDDDEPEDAKVEVILPQVQTVDSNYSDAGFWKIEGQLDDDIEALLADYE